MASIYSLWPGFKSFIHSFLSSFHPIVPPMYLWRTIRLQVAGHFFSRGKTSSLTSMIGMLSSSDTLKKSLSSIKKIFAERRGGDFVYNTENSSIFLGTKGRTKTFENRDENEHRKSLRENKKNETVREIVRWEFVEERKKMPIQGKKKGYRMNEDMKLIRKTTHKDVEDRDQCNLVLRLFLGRDWDQWQSPWEKRSQTQRNCGNAHTLILQSSNHRKM